MSLEHLPSVQSYWNHGRCFPFIQDKISRDQFGKIQIFFFFFHFNDNQKYLPWEDANHDRLYKLKQIFDILNNNFLSIPSEQNLSIANVPLLKFNITWSNTCQTNPLNRVFNFLYSLVFLGMFITSKYIQIKKICQQD